MSDFVEACVIQDYAAPSQGVLSLKKDEVILVMKRDESSGWWFGQNAQGQKGYFPPSWVKILEPPPPPAVESLPPPPMPPVDNVTAPNPNVNANVNIMGDMNPAGAVAPPMGFSDPTTSPVHHDLPMASTAAVGMQPATATGAAAAPPDMMGLSLTGPSTTVAVDTVVGAPPVPPRDPSLGIGMNAAASDVDLDSTGKGVAEAPSDFESRRMTGNWFVVENGRQVPVDNHFGKQSLSKLSPEEAKQLQVLRTTAPHKQTLKLLSNPTVDGWLVKNKREDDVLRNWKKRYCLLKFNILYYFKDQKPDTKPSGFIILSDCRCVEDKNRKFGFRVSTPSKVDYLFGTESPTQQQTWIAYVNKAISGEVSDDAPSSPGTATDAASSPGQPNVSVSVSVNGGGGADGGGVGVEGDDVGASESTHLGTRNDEELFDQVIGTMGDSQLDTWSRSVASLRNPDMTGWLTKAKEKTIKSWKKRFFVLKHSTMYYFKTEADTEPTGVIDLKGATVKEADKKNCIKVSTVSGVKYLLCADSKDGQKQWLFAVQAAL